MRVFGEVHLEEPWKKRHITNVWNVFLRTSLTKNDQRLHTLGKSHANREESRWTPHTNVFFGRGALLLWRKIISEVGFFSTCIMGMPWFSQELYISKEIQSIYIHKKYMYTVYIYKYVATSKLFFHRNYFMSCKIILVVSSSQPIDRTKISHGYLVVFPNFGQTKQIPSIKRVHIPPGEKETHLQNYLGKGIC